MININVCFYTDGRTLPFTAYAINGKTRYDWKTGNSELEAVTRLKATYISWENKPFLITRIKDRSF